MTYRQEGNRRSVFLGCVCDEQSNGSQEKLNYRWQEKSNVGRSENQSWHWMEKINGVSPKRTDRLVFVDK